MVRDEYQNSAGGHWAGIVGTLLLHALLIGLVLLTNLRFEALSLLGGAPPPPPPPLAMDVGSLVDTTIDAPDPEPTPEVRRRDPDPAPTPESDPDPPHVDDIELPTNKPTPTPAPTRTPTPTRTPVPTRTPAPTPSPAATPTARPQASPTPNPKPTATPAPTATKAPKPTPSASPTPRTEAARPSEPTRSPRPTATPKPTPRPLSAAEIRAMREQLKITPTGRDKPAATPGSRNGSSSARAAAPGGRAGGVEGGVDGGVAGGKEGGVVGARGMTLDGAGTGRSSGLPDSYARGVLGAIGRHFVVPEEQKLDARAAVAFTIRRNGTIANPRITRSSGSSALDALAMQALQKTARVMPLPDSFEGDSVDVEVGFGFNE